MNVTWLHWAIDNWTRRFHWVHWYHWYHWFKKFHWVNLYYFIGYFYIAIPIFILFYIIVLINGYIYREYERNEPIPRTTPCKTIICMGSGGHTTEMLTLLKGLNLNKKYTPRYYFIAKDDKSSLHKVQQFENDNEYNICEIPRSRIVNQSYISSIFTTLYSIYYTVPLVYKIKPDLILCNGPGTCIPICFAGFLLQLANIKRNLRIIFIESYCRTKTLSLSGRILLRFADHFIVQWPTLERDFPKVEYLGPLM